MASEERLRELEEKYENFTVYDNQGSKIGKVDDLFVDESDNEEYIGVKMGFLGTKSTLIPTEIVRVNEADKSVEVSESKDHVKDAPSFSDDDEIDAAYEERIRSHFGLGALESSGRGSYGSHAEGEEGPATAGAASGGAASGTEDRGGDPEYASSAQETSSESRGETSAYGTGSEGHGESSGVDTDYGERGDQTSSSGSETRGGEAGTNAPAGTPTTASGDRETVASDRGGSATGEQPTTSRQTEETETFQEGGRTKIRRRIIREEVVDADDEEPGRG